MSDGITLNAASGGATLATDDAGASGHLQLVKLGIASDGSATLIPADNTNGLLVDVSRVQGTVTVGSHAVTNAGTFAVQVDGAALTALQIIDNPVLVDDAAFTPGTSSVMMAGFEFDDTTPDSVNEGDAGAARMSARREVYIQLRDAAGNERGANVDASNRLEVAVGNTVTVASHAVTNAGTFAVQVDGAALTSLQLIDDVIATDGAAAPTKGAQIAGSDGTNAQIVSTTTGGHVHIHDGGNSITVDNGGTFAVQESGGALTALQLIDDAIVADDAAFTPATTKVMMAGFEFDDTAPDPVNEGDAGAARMSANRNVYTTIRDAAGNERGANVNASSQLSVSVDNTVTVGSHAVTNAGTFAVQVDGAALTALQLIDDAIFAEDVAAQAADKGIAILAVRRDADTSLVGADNDYANLQVNAAGALKVEIFDGGDSHTVDGTVTANQGGTWNIATVSTVSTVTAIGTSVTPGTAAANLGKAEDAAHASGDTGVAVWAVRRDSPAVGSGTDGDYSPINVDSAGQVRVSTATAATATLSNVNDAASSTSLLSSTTTRRGVIVFNDSTSDLYLKYGATASTTSFTYKIPGGVAWEMPQPIYTGAIDGIWSADASGAARITELT